MEDIKSDLNKRLGLSLTIDELNELSDENIISYLRFHHEKNYGTSTIMFLGFSNEELTSLVDITNSCDLIVKSRISSDLTFLCYSGSADNHRIKKAQTYGTKILSETDFKMIFADSTYNLSNHKLLYDCDVLDDLKIVQPLSNFDKKINVESFSLGTERTYTINLYRMTCDCLDFEKGLRGQYSKGDIRRMCKHLMYEYKNRFGLTGLSAFNKSAIEIGHALHKFIKKIHLENVSHPIMVNFTSNEDWWSIFFPNEHGGYKRYGYFPLQNRFSYDDKPSGFVVSLKHQLQEIHKQLAIDTRTEFISQRNIILVFYLSILAVVVFIILYLVF